MKRSKAMEFGIKLAQQTYSSMPYSKESALAAFKHHNISVNPAATDAQIEAKYRRMGRIAPGQKPNAFQKMLYDYHGGKEPAPTQPEGFGGNVSAARPAGSGNTGPASPATPTTGAAVPPTPQPGVQPSGQGSPVPPQMPVPPAQRAI